MSRGGLATGWYQVRRADGSSVGFYRDFETAEWRRQDNPGAEIFYRTRGEAPEGLRLFRDEQEQAA